MFRQGELDHLCGDIKVCRRLGHGLLCHALLAGEIGLTHTSAKGQGCYYADYPNIFENTIKSARVTPPRKATLECFFSSPLASGRRCDAEI
jgi:hypothetical protein